MAGGVGRRMASKVPKPLIQFKGRPLIKWVFEAAAGCSHMDSIAVAITRATYSVKGAVDADFVVTDGRGYVEDMVSAITQLGLEKTLVLSADLPLLTAPDLDWVVEEYRRLGAPALAVFVPVELCRKLGITRTMEIDGLVPAGINIVDGRDLDGEESRLVTSNPRFAFNINTPGDLERAAQFAREAH
ncbi:MAG: hypothetical protein D6733_00785 [Methanobacteriota archaeon]|nr:MAG: hypothetical protein D6733_00785 [Euryarchaeota archaeon]